MKKQDIKIIKWSAIYSAPPTTVVEEGVINDDIDIVYEILPNQQRVDQIQNGFMVNGFMVNRISPNYTYEEGILGDFEGEVGICCGIVMYSAMGLPSKSKCNGDIEYVKLLAEVDIRNLKEGKNNLFIDKLKKK